MKRSTLFPFALSTLVLALSGCGGESGNLINENESAGVTASSSCNPENNNCFSFQLTYPVAGLNFTCSSDNVNNFVTVIEGNLTTGACALGDDVSFSITGRNTENKINLGKLDLDKISLFKFRGSNNAAVPSAISILDIAAAINNGQAATSLTPDDPTIKVAVALVRIFQAIGIAQAQNVAGDIQPISLTDEFKQGLSKATGSVSLADYLNGNYATILRNWVDVSGISNEEAFNLVVKVANQNTTGVYLADILTINSSGNTETLINSTGLEGFHGRAVSGNTSRELIANMYSLTDRSGFNVGYGLQWKGIPPTTTTGNNGSTTPINSTLLRFGLLSQVAPEKMTVLPQQNWLNPLSKKINPATPFRFDVDTDDALLSINQGELLNNSAFVGTEKAYKLSAKTDVAAPEKYTTWTQTGSSGDYAGTLEISKFDQVTYLDRRVFKTLKNSFAGERYLFPLYADLEFRFKDTSITPVKLGIVIDENGDIRTNMRANATADDMSSGNVCTTVDNNLMADNGVQQYRIGTTGAANFTSTDQSITMRMILSNPVFGKLEGVIAGINQSIGVTGSNAVLSGSGIKINVGNLLSNISEGSPVTVTNFSDTTAQWANIYAVYQGVYNARANADTNTTLPKPTTAQIDLAKRTEGSIASVSLPSCYRVQVK